MREQDLHWREVAERALRTAVLDARGSELGKISADTMITDLGINSMDLLQVVGSIEDELAIELPTEELYKVYTVGSLVEAIASRLLHPRNGADSMSSSARP